MDQNRDGCSPGIDVACDLVLSVGHINNIEPTGRNEMRDQASARLASVEIEHGRRHMIDGEGRGIPINDHLENERNNQTKHRPSVSSEFEKFLHQHDVQAFEHGLVQSLAKRAGGEIDNHDRIQR